MIGWIGVLCDWLCVAMCGHVWQGCNAVLGSVLEGQKATCDHVPARILSIERMPVRSRCVHPKGPKSHDPELQKMNEVL